MWFYSLIWVLGVLFSKRSTCVCVCVCEIKVSVCIIIMYYDYCEDKEDLKKSIEKEAEEFMQPESTAESHKQSTAPQSPPPKKKKLCAFLKKVEEESSDLSPEVKVANEVESYIGSPNLDIGSDLSPLKWWKEHTNSYPTLAKLAIKILCVCAVSCASRFH